jgi:prolipoprotein diacylglyceryltransferase
MLPILVSLGPVKIYAFGVLIAIGLFVALYYWWKMGRDEHWDEIALFDGYFLSLLVFVVVGRIGYVLAHYGDVGTLYRALAILSYPGISVIVGLCGMAVFAVLFARYHDWPEWKVSDAMVVALSVALVFGGLGSLFNGTNPNWQMNAVFLAWTVITFVTVVRVRKNFRFYSWYKGESSVAQDGLASLVFALLAALYFAIGGIFGQGLWQLGLVVALITPYLIYRRVGRREASLWGKLISVIRRK